ncbi:MAG: thiosulfate oxidation carrier complex protein SoxZ [Sinobacteraceae bacterium]|nr:thiosulfate oxidation carrier complex protein SoxZ [Nevskiaceae bacterium]
MAKEKKKWQPKHTIKVKAVRGADGVTTVKALISHPMDSGFEFTYDFVPIPAHFIETLTFVHNDKTVFRCNWGPAVAKDPFLSFKFGGAKAGDSLDAKWVDNEGMRDSGHFTIA